jgi:hypothetical protein
MDEALSELDNLDSLISSYKIHLNVSFGIILLCLFSTLFLQAVGDDILYIQSQNRGLQVQNQNQRALLAEIQNLLASTLVNEQFVSALYQLQRTVHVDQEALATLTQESLEKTQSIQRIEEAAVQLYKALQAGRDTGLTHLSYIIHVPNAHIALQIWLRRWKDCKNIGPTTHNFANEYLIFCRSLSLHK